VTRADPTNFNRLASVNPNPAEILISLLTQGTLVRINRVGLRVPGLLPADRTAYFIYGDPVLAPCQGRVVFAEDGAADMPPPQADRAHMAGNHVILECGCRQS